jgi:hypothetical protein
VDGYFSILLDTLLGSFLPAWRPAFKVREQAHPKFYWFDPGVARAAAGSLRDPVDRTWKGRALETLMLHEIRCYNQAAGRHRPLFYYGTPHQEIDFVVELSPRRGGEKPRILCIEAKMAGHWDRAWERPMRDLALQPGVSVARQIGVYTGRETLRYRDVLVLPAVEFFRRLHGGDVF